MPSMIELDNAEWALVEDLFDPPGREGHAGVESVLGPTPSRTTTVPSRDRRPGNSLTFYRQR
ncbi:MAG: hypothetical protein V4515_07270 [Chloroflexota bacterium]